MAHRKLAQDAVILSAHEIDAHVIQMRSQCAGNAQKVINSCRPRDRRIMTWFPRRYVQNGPVFIKVGNLPQMISGAGTYLPKPELAGADTAWPRSNLKSKSKQDPGWALASGSIWVNVVCST